MAKNDIIHAYVGDLVAKRGEDGHLRVKGLATDATLDLDEQICDPEWLKSAMPAWMEIGNIREMHQSKAVGKAMEMSATGNGGYVVEAKIVDKNAAQMVEEGIYTGFSVGIKGARVIKDASAPGGRIVGGKIVEVSLVDRPANPSAVIEIAKSVDGELVKGSAVTDLDKTSDLNAEAIHHQVSGDADSAKPEVGDTAFQPCNNCGGTGFKSNVPENDIESVECENCAGTGVQPEGQHENIRQDSPSIPADSNDVNSMMKEVDGDLEKKDYSDAERADMADAGEALPNGGFPIKTVKDLKNAIQSIGRAKNRAEAIAHIKTRAKALGREDLIPDTFKAVEHDEATLEQVRSAMIALIKAELDEMLAGDEDETCDVQELLCALSIFLEWWEGESDESETVAPFKMDDDDEDEVTPAELAFVGLGVSADIIKAAVATEATDADKTALRDEFRKALGVDEEIATYKAALAEQEEGIMTLKAALDEIREMAVPGGPALRQTQQQTQVSAKGTALRVEAERLRYTAAQLHNPELRGEYLESAKRLEAEADNL